LTRSGVVITLFVLTTGLLQVFWFFSFGAVGVDPLTTPDAERYYIEATGINAYQRVGSVFDNFYFPITETFGFVLRVFYKLGLQEPESLVIVNYIFNLAAALVFMRIARLERTRCTSWHPSGVLALRSCWTIQRNS